jgi:hypothetical protein
MAERGLPWRGHVQQNAARRKRAHTLDRTELGHIDVAVAADVVDEELPVAQVVGIKRE